MIVETNSAWTLKVIDDGKSGAGLEDYQMLDNGKPAGVLEVGRNTDGTATKNTAAWLRRASQPRVLPGLRWSWGLLCDGEKAMFKRIFDLALPILKELEGAGIQRVDRFSRDNWKPNSFSARLMEIGVMSASMIDEHRKPGYVIVTLGSSVSAPLGPQPVVLELEQWLGSNEPDQAGLRRKLTTHLPQRHAFVWVDLRSPWAAWRALEEDPLPTGDPQLPSPMNGVWVANATAGWMWSAGSGWSKLRNVREAVSHAA
jgi:hypothetical protein